MKDVKNDTEVLLGKYMKLELMIAETRRVINNFDYNYEKPPIKYTKKLKELLAIREKNKEKCPEYYI
jgi:hypothetical protein